MTAATTCADCKGDLDDVAEGAPCPRCGGGRRSVNLQAGAAIVVVAAIAPTFEVGYNPEPGWAQQWHTIQYHLARLRQQYSGEREVDNQEMGQTVTALMIALWHLIDWLREDGDIQGPLNKLLTTGSIYSRIRDDFPALLVCGGFANTVKHSKRRNPCELTARNATFSSAGPKMTIRYGLAGDDRASNVDALELAEQCEKAWRDLLSEHGVTVPGH
jgi:hypothetical protein